MRKLSVRVRLLVWALVAMVVPAFAVCPEGQVEDSSGNCVPDFAASAQTVFDSLVDVMSLLLPVVIVLIAVFMGPRIIRWLIRVATGK